MAHPIATDASATATLLRKCWYGDGQADMAMLKFRVHYTGVVWQVSTSNGNYLVADSVSATWDGANSKVDLSWASFSTENPVLTFANVLIEATPYGKASGWTTPNYSVQSYMVTSSTGYLAFYAGTDSLVLQTTEATAMDCIVTLTGTLS